MPDFRSSNPRSLRSSVRRTLLLACATIAAVPPQSTQAGSEHSAIPYKLFQPSSAEIETHMSPQFRSCVARSGGVTETMDACMVTEFERLEAIMASAYDASLRRLSGKGARDDLQSRQDRWRAQRPNDCIGDASSMGGGSASALAYGNCMLRETIRRTLWLEPAARAGSEGQT